MASCGFGWGVLPFLSGGGVILRASTPAIFQFGPMAPERTGARGAECEGASWAFGVKYEGRHCACRHSPLCIREGSVRAVAFCVTLRGAFSCCYLTFAHLL